VQVRVTINETGEVADASAVDGHPLLRDAAVEAARQWQFKPTELGGTPVKVNGVLTFNFTLGDDPANATTLDIPIMQRSGAGVGFGAGVSTGGITKIPTNVEKLGKQVIEGVECEGTRSTTTLPAGAVGNEQPIQAVSESWYSPELKLTLRTRRTDPRFGESTYRVTNLVRAEPEPSLFQLPNDYTIKEGGASSFSFSGPDGMIHEGMEKMREQLRTRMTEERKAKPDNQ
jgi:TonB family protein